MHYTLWQLVVAAGRQQQQPAAQTIVSASNHFGLTPA
jgi:hypothetical protein